MIINLLYTRAVENELGRRALPKKIFNAALKPEINSFIVLDFVEFQFELKVSSAWYGLTLTSDDDQFLDNALDYYIVLDLVGDDNV